MTDNQQPSVTQADEDTRSNSRFFFELGLVAALAHSLVEGGVPSNDHAFDRCWDVALASYEDPQEMERRLANADAADLRAENERLREAMQSSLDQLDWINAQAENAMATSAGAATASGDSDGSLEMLNSIASDIGINAMMIRDKLSAVLSTQTSAGGGE